MFNISASQACKWHGERFEFLFTVVSLEPIVWHNECLTKVLILE